MHKIVYESLQRLIWNGCKECQANELHTLKEVVIEIAAISKPDHQSLSLLLEGKTFKQVAILLISYCTQLLTNKGSVTELWMSYIDAVEILLALI